MPFPVPEPQKEIINLFEYEGCPLASIRRTGGYLLNEAARETAHADTRKAMPRLTLTLGGMIYE